MDISYESLERFHEKIESFSHVPAEEFQRLAAIMHFKEYKRGEVLLRGGQVCRQFFFIVRGYIRSFCIEDGIETNVNFYFEDDIASDFKSLRSGKPADCWLVAMENCLVHYAVKNEYEKVFNESVALQAFLFRFFQDMYLREEEDANTFRLFSPEERYNHIISFKPHFLQRIPQQHLASFLGVSRKTLTRIRKK